MEGSSTYNPGFLGSHFNWWIGQIADDSTWRDNNPSGKHANSAQRRGWAKRYKVRIIGIHDMGEANIPSDQLPFAQVMYPVTAGGGQAESFQTANLSQGNMVFGFFLDGQDQQVPVIMGVLGNNSGSFLSMSIGDNRVTDNAPGFIGKSGYARGAIARLQELRAPDDGLVIEKPGISDYLKIDRSADGNITDEYGLHRDVNYPKDIYIQKQLLTQEAEEKYTNVQERIDYVKDKLSSYLEKLRNFESGPFSPSRGVPTKESVDAFHQQSVADIKKTEFYDKKIPLMKASEPILSAINAIQTIMEEFLFKVDKYLHTFQSYLESASSDSNVGLEQLKQLMKKVARRICKYIKIVIDKVMEYVLKVFNKAFSVIISSIPGSYRHLFGDIKEQMTEKINCLYSKITNKQICPIVENILEQSLDLDALQKDVNEFLKNRGKYYTDPNVYTCYPEDILSETFFNLSDDINTKNKDLLNNMSRLIDDFKNLVSADINIPGLSSINGNINTALSFKNINLNVFGCDLMPDIPVSDFYTLSGGSGGQSQRQIPSIGSVNNKIPQSRRVKNNVQGPKPFASPSKNQVDVIYRGGNR